MYRYVEDKEFVSRMRSLCGDIMQEFCHILKEDYGIGAIFYLVGSGARNLIMQNENNPIDLDYNLEIVKCEDYYDYRHIKESARLAFNKALNSFGWDDCDDSTSSLTTKKRYFTKGNQTPFSMDVCIVTVDTEGTTHRLIHKKTGWICKDEYYWNEAPHSKNIRAKADYIKRNGSWTLVRKEYKDIKNLYLRRNDHNHPSFICYIEAVNNVYNAIRQ